VDVHRDVLRILALEEQQLGNDQRSHVVFDFTGDEDDALAQQAAEDVEAACAPSCACGHERRVCAGVRIGVDIALHDLAPAVTAAVCTLPCAPHPPPEPPNTSIMKSALF